MFSKVRPALAYVIATLLFFAELRDGVWTNLFLAVIAYLTLLFIEMQVDRIIRSLGKDE